MENDTLSQLQTNTDVHILAGKTDNPKRLEHYIHAITQLATDSPSSSVSLDTHLEVVSRLKKLRASDFSEFKLVIEGAAATHDLIEDFGHDRKLAHQAISALSNHTEELDKLLNGGFEDYEEKFQAAISDVAAQCHIPPEFPLHTLRYIALNQVEMRRHHKKKLKTSA